MIGLLKLYAPAIVLLVLAVLVPFTGDSPVIVVMRLVVLAISLAISISEQRRIAGARRRRNGGE